MFSDVIIWRQSCVWRHLKSFNSSSQSNGFLNLYCKKYGSGKIVEKTMRIFSSKSEADDALMLAELAAQTTRMTRSIFIILWIPKHLSISKSWQIKVILGGRGIY